MNSGTFHVLAQEWRYFSREKSLAQTLHLGQLNPTKPGDTVLVLPVEDVSTNAKGYGFPPMQFPSGPSFITNLQKVTNSSMVITCYGATSCAGITAQAHMGITIAQGGSIARVTFTPEESGFFAVAAYCYSDIHHYGSEGVDGHIALQITNGGAVVAKAEGKLKQEGTMWADPSIDADFYRRLSCNTSALVLGAGSIVAEAQDLGSDSCITAWCMKVSDYP